MQHLTDQELIEAYARGEEHAFAILVQRYLQPIYRFLLRLVREKELAEDLSQETFVRAWKKFSTFDQTRSFKAWLFAIARYAAFDALKKKQPLRFSELSHEQTFETGIEASLPDDRPSPEELLLVREQKAQVEAFLSELPLGAQEVILLHDDQDLTFQEIADTIKQPLNTVKSRYRRALLLLRKTLLDRSKKDPPGPQDLLH
jgi:RNA polymerase sigma factor (sigma-70 family)